MSYSHILAAVDQPKSREYIYEMISIVEEWIEANIKAKKVPSFAMIGLVQVVISVLGTKALVLNTSNIANEQKLAELQSSYRELLSRNLRRRLEKPEKLKDKNDERTMSLYKTMDAFDAIGTTQYEIADLRMNYKSFTSTLMEINPKLRHRFELFMFEHDKTIDRSSFHVSKGEIASIIGRKAIKREVLATTEGLAEPDRLQLASRILADTLEGDKSIENLLALRHVIASCESKFHAPLYVMTLMFSRYTESYKRWQ